jgi:hypothetical protein
MLKYSLLFQTATSHVVHHTIQVVQMVHFAKQEACTRCTALHLLVLISFTLSTQVLQGLLMNGCKKTQHAQGVYVFQLSKSEQYYSEKVYILQCIKCRTNSVSGFHELKSFSYVAQLIFSIHYNRNAVETFGRFHA